MWMHPKMEKSQKGNILKVWAWIILMAVGVLQCSEVVVPIPWSITQMRK